VGLDNQSLELFGQTPWQTVGPFFHYGLPWKGGADLIGDSDLGARPELAPEAHYVLATPPRRGSIVGEAITLIGRVSDAEGAPVPDALIEIWQANSAGRYNCAADDRWDIPLDPTFTGFGRSATAEDGSFRFLTLAPGPTPGPGNSQQAPHIAVGVLGRGLLKRLVTRIYFAGQPLNELDPILALVAPSRRDTLLATTSVHEPAVWRFDIRLGGDDETVFFDC
jgi:protocatechuate 3,4-dioxygenase alpha subunit